MVPLRTFELWVFSMTNYIQAETQEAYTTHTESAVNTAITRLYATSANHNKII